jgi:ABC-type transport system substrate-binding protein
MARVVPWREARKGMAGVVSVLLSAVVVVTTLFFTKPPIILQPAHTGYDFTYTYHQPTHQGGAITIGFYYANDSLVPPALPRPSIESGPETAVGLWNGCVVQLPDLTLGLKGWKADQCTEVPTNANGGESLDGKTTTFHIDPHAVWSDGVPITADDFQFTFQLVRDPNIGGLMWGTGSPWNLMRLTTLDAHTLRIDWSVPYGDYLTALALLTPLPLHVYTHGPFAGVFDPRTGTYNFPLAQRLVADPSFTMKLPADNGPFKVQSAVPKSRVVLVKNPRFFSNYFHAPALDQVTLVSVYKDKTLNLDQTLIDAYRKGGLSLAEGLGPLDLGHLEDIPNDQVSASPVVDFVDVAFNQRSVAPNARANGGVSLLGDIRVRRALVEAFDHCASVRDVLGIRDCNDPNFHSDELSAPPAPDYDPTVKLPAYDPGDAAALLDHAGYRVVGSVRRYKDGKTPLELTLIFPDYFVPPGVAHKMQQDYAQNLKIAVHVVSDPDMFEPGGARQTGAFDIALVADGLIPDPVGRLTFWGWDSASIPSPQNPNGANVYGLNDPWVITQDQLGARTTDADQRAEVYRELARHVAEQLAIVPLFILPDIALVKPTLCNFKKWPTLGQNLWNIADWYLARGSTCP